MAVNIDEILALPENERRALRQILDESLAEEADFELTQEEWAEIEQALEEYECDPSKAIPAREAMKRLRGHHAI